MAHSLSLDPRSLAVAAFMAAGAVLPATAASLIYRVDPLPPGADVYPRYAQDINDQGEVIGDGYHPHGVFTYKDGVTSLRVKGRTSVYTINNAGVSVGAIGKPVVSYDAHIFGADGTTVNLGPLMDCGKRSVAIGINDMGVVVGDRECNKHGQGSFIYQDGQVSILPQLPGAPPYTHAIAVTNDGLVAGSSDTADGEYHAVTWRNGIIRDLGTLGGDFSASNAVNELGHVVGISSVDEVESRGFLHDGQSMRALPKCDGHGYVYPRGINRDGRIVGEYHDGQDWHIFVIDGDRCYPLKDLLDDSGQQWDDLSWTAGINDAGQFVGTGVYQGKKRGFIATPVATR